MHHLLFTIYEKSYRGHYSIVNMRNHFQFNKTKSECKSSTESEMNAVDNIIPKLLWTKCFIESQGHKIDKYIILQDNTSTMQLESNSNVSSGKRTKHFDIKFF